MRLAIRPFLVIAVLAAGCPSSTPQVPCQPGSCSGCCDAQGHCQLGDTATTCGFGGTTCAVCAPGQSCGGGQCVDGGPVTADGGPLCGLATGCHGCCDGAGQCQLGTTDQVCGNTGGQCSSCLPNGSCQGGFCVQPCNATTCDGCCNGPASGDCIRLSAESDVHCGSASDAGSTCIMCAFMCVNGACGGCTPATCPTGCCDVTGACQFATDQTCGANGAACVACGAGQICQSNGPDAACVAPADPGAACTSDLACDSVVGGSICREVTQSGVAYPGGYCTVDCTFDAFVCQVGTTCTAVGGLFGEPGTLCLTACPCREPGYSCHFFDSVDGGLCFIDPPAPPGLEGAPCVTDDQCLDGDAGPGTGFCLSGHCSAQCGVWAQQGLADAYCGDGGACLTLPQFQSEPLCFQTCAAPLAGQSTCATGAVCKPGSPGAFCGSRCDLMDAGCPAGLSCGDGGYCCDGGMCQ